MSKYAAIWAPHRVLVAMGWLLALAFASLTWWNAFSAEKTGTLLLGFATVIFAALALHGTVLRPRLSANHTGVLIRSLSGSQQLSWHEISFQLRETRRLGRDSSALELEYQDHLVVYGWLELGEDPRDVFDALGALSARAQTR